MTRSAFAVLVAVVLAGMPLSAKAAPVGFWEFDGDLTDSSGMGNNGTFSGGTATYGPDRRDAAASAIVLDGTDDKVTVSATGRPSNTFSFGGWILTTETHEIDSQSNGGTAGTGGQNYAFGAYNGGSDAAGAGLSVGTNGISVYEHGSSYMPALAVYNPGGTAAIGTNWNHILVVYEDRVPTIYLNGVPVQTGVQSARDTVYAPYEIAAGSYGNLSGSMDAVGVWDHALTLSEVAELADRPIVGNGSFEWDTFTSYPGYSSTGNNGSISGWTVSGTSVGINPADNGADDPTPFANNGLVPDGSQVAFIQTVTAERWMEQTVVGMEPGEHYLLSYRENARSQTGRPRATVTLDGATVVAAHTVTPVEGSGSHTVPYRYVGSGVLTATSETADLRFSAVRATSAEDASLLLDDIQILPARLLFADNFSVQANSTDINPSSNDLPGRQTGLYAGATYTERTSNPADYVQVDHADYPQALRLAASNPGTGLISVSPDVNFTSFSGAQHFMLEYDLKPTEIGSLSSWSAVVVGASSQTASVNTSDGIGFLIRGSGGYQIFDGTDGANDSKQSGTLASPLDPEGWYDVRINYYAPAFDDVSRGGVSIFVDDTLIYSAVTDSGFLNNYLVFLGEAEGGLGLTSYGIDNIRLWAAVPEPSAALLFGFGMLFMSLPRIRRRRPGD